MKLIIAGSRSFNDYNLLKEKIIALLANTDYNNVTIISGKAKGADSLGEKFAIEHGIKVESKPALWDTYGKSAGYIRNEEMAKCATHCVVFWDGSSKGSMHMINLAKDYNLQLRVIMF
jgi:hypothetical protein